MYKVGDIVRVTSLTSKLHRNYDGYLKYAIPPFLGKEFKVKLVTEAKYVLIDYSVTLNTNTDNYIPFDCIELVGQFKTKDIYEGF